jgi:hypothetical protein
MTDVKSDPDLDMREKETAITWTNDSETATVYTDQRAMVRGLLEHDHAEILHERVKDGHVVGVKAKVPVGCIKVKGKPRKDNSNSRVAP